MEAVNQPVVGSASIAERRATPYSFIAGQLCPINNITKDELYAINSAQLGLADCSAHFMSLVRTRS